MKRVRRSRQTLWGAVASSAILLCMPCPVSASGPRFVSGPPFFTGPAGVPIGWKQPQLLYFTDPGDLSASVPHVAADVLVAQAANVWNVPMASITLGRGGTLAEDVSGQNVFLDSSGIVYPSDVTSANAATIPLAILYDTDGSIVDTLLGAGASDPTECRQNAVLEEVDAFDPAGYILHARLVLNGRCTGPAPEQQMEMRYQLMRAFGRVLGLAWSQTNDNVFTGVPTPTYDQALHWPIMHPIDIFCGPYSYQCLPNPFQLRPDDLASMVAVYPIAQGGVPTPGKQVSLQAANLAEGTISFPTGEGMAGVNVLVRRSSTDTGVDESWYEASGVSGTDFRRAGISPFFAADASAPASQGTLDQSRLGSYRIAYVPLQTGGPFQTLKTSTEPVNPLYTGAYSIGPYSAGSVAPSGTAPAAESNLFLSEFADAKVDFTISDAAASCGDGTDGTAADPALATASGWWRGLLCGYGHAAYVTFNVRPGRTFAVEVTALDEQGFSTGAKTMPVIGLFAPSDLPTDLPSLGATAAAFNSADFGTTSLSGQTGQLSRLRVGIADERGDGRPDFAYQARIFYADSISPDHIGTAGGQVVISGMGFRVGNSVLINGVPAQVVSWSATSLIVIAPTRAIARAVDMAAVDVVVQDRSTGATSTLSQAFTYDSAAVLPDSIKLYTAPSGIVLTGDIAPTLFAVQVIAGDGKTPVAGASVTFSTLSGSTQFNACGATICTVQTNAAGIASTGVTPLSAGVITVQAADGTQTQVASFTAQQKAGLLQVVSAPNGTNPTGQPTASGFAVRLFGVNGATLADSAITFSVPAGGATYAGCAAATCTVRTDSSGYAAIGVTPITQGAITLRASGGGISQSVTFTATNGSNQLLPDTVPAATSNLHTSAGVFAVRLVGPDGSTGVPYAHVLFTAPEGAFFDACQTNVCEIGTNTLGQAGSGVEAVRPGTYTIQATYQGMTQTATFVVVAPTLHLQILSAPQGTIPVGVPATAAFAAQLLGYDGVTPVPGASITLSGATDSVLFDSCLRSACLLDADQNGTVSTKVTPLRSGTITLSAVSGSLLQTATFQVSGGAETLRILSQPGPAGAFTGDPVTLTVQLLQPDGVTPVAGTVVDFSVVQGAFAFRNCGTALCRIITDSNGIALIVGVPTSVGAVGVQVMADSIIKTIVFPAFVKAGVLELLSFPSSAGFSGTTAATPFAVKLFTSDGVTPASGQSVTVSVTSGSAALAACAGASTCILQTDARGEVVSLVTPLAAGTITLTAANGPLLQTASFTVQPSPGSNPPTILNAVESQTYVAEAQSGVLTLHVTAVDNGIAVIGESVGWTGTTGFAVSASSSVTGVSGTATVQAVAGPLAAGAQASAEACVLTNTCVQFSAIGVAARDLRILILSGGQQDTTSGAALGPVVALVTDALGHPVLSAPVNIFQTITALTLDCPDRGRCPQAPVLNSSGTVVSTDQSGQVSLTPLTMPGSATQTKIALSVGTQGFATAVLSSRP